MQNKTLSAITVAFLLSSTTAFAAGMDNTTSSTTSTTTSNSMDMNSEYCTVTDKDGNNVVKAGQADCNSMVKMNCKAGSNVDGDANASILVPKGQCDNVKKGDFSGMSSSMASKIKAKLDMNKLMQK